MVRTFFAFFIDRLEEGIESDGALAIAENVSVFADHAVAVALPIDGVVTHLHPGAAHSGHGVVFPAQLHLQDCAHIAVHEWQDGGVHEAGVGKRGEGVVGDVHGVEIVGEIDDARNEARAFAGEVLHERDFGEEEIVRSHDVGMDGSGGAEALHVRSGFIGACGGGIEGPGAGNFHAQPCPAVGFVLNEALVELTVDEGKIIVARRIQGGAVGAPITVCDIQSPLGAVRCVGVHLAGGIALLGGEHIDALEDVARLGRIVGGGESRRGDEAGQHGSYGVFFHVHGLFVVFREK